MNRYTYAKEKYAAFGVNTDAAIEKLMNVPVALHCWQGDDVRGFDLRFNNGRDFFHWRGRRLHVLRDRSGFFRASFRSCHTVLPP